MPRVFSAPTVSAAGVFAGEMIAAHNRPAVLRLAQIAGRRDHHEPRVDRALHRLAERVFAVGFEDGVPEREVDDPELILRLVRDGPVDGVDDVAGLALTVRAEHPEADDVRLGRDAGVGPLIMPCDDARDVRAVPEAIAAQPRPAREVHARDDPAAERGVRGDAGVDDRDADAASPEAVSCGRGQVQATRGAAPDLRRAGRLVRDRHHAADGHVPRQVGDVRVFAERDQLAAGDLEHSAPADALPDMRPVARRKRLYLGGRSRNDDAGGFVGSCGDAVSQIAREPRPARTRLRGYAERNEHGGDGETDAAARRQSCTRKFNHGNPQNNRL